MSGAPPKARKRILARAVESESESESELELVLSKLLQSDELEPDLLAQCRKMAEICRKADPTSPEIIVKVDGRGLVSAYFIINRTTQLKELMINYCYRKYVDFNSIAFLYKGRHLHPEQTPLEQNMVHLNYIDVIDVATTP